MVSSDVNTTGGWVMRSRLREIVLQKELDNGKRILQIDIANETGLTETTISKWMDVKPLKRIEVETMMTLARWAGLDDPREMLAVERLA